jgi:predicted nucleic acid-binding protein
VARELGIRAVGTLGVLIEADIEGLIDFQPAIRRPVNETPFYAWRNVLDVAHRIFQDGRDGSKT